MPANKSQHFVPRCYLRAFCADDEGAAINVFNMARELLIQAAPAKGQCAKPYFYGRDGELERALQEPEGEYGEIMRRVVNDPHAATWTDISTLSGFMLLQSYRSAAWIEGEIRLAEAERAMVADEATPELLESLVVTHEMALQLALSAFRNSIESTAHLQTRIVLNRTVMPFFTSDDPVVYTNRFHLQKNVLGGAGIGSPGAMLLMPLTPRFLLLSFDPAIYRLEKLLGKLGVIDRVSDVAAFNDLQAVRGHANLYFRDWNDRALVASMYEKAKPRRRETWFDVETLQETEAGSNTFVAVAGRWVHHPGRREMLHTQRNIPAPATWPSLLTYTEHARRARRGVDQASLWE
ncbi:DUF4238 domain-containing protein [Taklimakanibacter albus]|uniref:DUF4238 domain-containing protein n=1 Tax=Taklimakanibacter albus TaxID=2800327 RepID=A0ACC5RBU2_9HYPH|nr:DUF4238 domain-containing protein [Aestuariivirga sp. YIM B02566]MBK1870161.1 DUF4238 domain-containing protein [Aestuariivirga sp. YIM B02566]